MTLNKKLTNKDNEALPKWCWKFTKGTLGA